MRHETSAASRWARTIAVPAIALLGIAPWMVNNLSLMRPVSPSPFPASLENIKLIIDEHGIAIIILVLWGIRAGLRATANTRFVSWLMLIWLLLVLEFSAIGFIGRLLPPFGLLTNAPNLARHGLVLPLVWFAGLATLDIWDKGLSPDLKRRLRGATYPLIAVAVLLLLLGALAFKPLLGTLGFLAPSLTDDDVAAMTWLRDNTRADALIMATDGNAWLPLFAERRAPDFRAVRYFEWDQISGVDVERSEVNYVYVPADAAPPLDLPVTLVFDQGDARVYQLSDP